MDGRITEDSYIYAEDTDTKEDIDAILSGVRFFTVTLDADGKVIKTNTRNTNTVDAGVLRRLHLTCIEEEKKTAMESIAGTRQFLQETI